MRATAPKPAHKPAAETPVAKPALLLALLLAGTGAALAGEPRADWMPMDQALRKLGEAGYGDVRALKADDGRWEGKAVKDGRPVGVAVDPRSGAVSEKAGKAEGKKGEGEAGKRAETDDD